MEDSVALDGAVVFVGEVDALAARLVDDVINHLSTLFVSEFHIRGAANAESYVATVELTVRYGEVVVVLALFVL